MGFAESVVLRLMNNYLDEGATLFTDNFYKSIPLALERLSCKTYQCGTVRSSWKGLLEEIISAKLKNKETSALENTYGVKAFHWKDKRNLYTLSKFSEHDDKFIRQVKFQKMVLKEKGQKVP